MYYRVSESYLADRRAGPRRASIMAALALAFIAFLAYSQQGATTKDEILVPLAFTGIFTAGIAYFVVSRMKRMTLAMENLLFTVTADGIAVESGSGPFTIKASDIRKITMYRTVFAPKTAYFVIAGKAGGAALPPLENADTFAQEIQGALPTIPFVRRRKIIVNFSS